MVTIVLPFAATEAGLKAHFVFSGSPEQEKATVPLKPSRAVISALNVPADPTLTGRKKVPSPVRGRSVLI
jgi:hypothetical protein